MINDVIIRKKHWRRKKQWDTGLDSAPDVSKEATPLGSHGEKLKPMSADRVAVSNS